MTEMATLRSGQLRQWGSEGDMFLLVGRSLKPFENSMWWWQCLQVGVIMWWEEQDLEQNSKLLSDT